MSHYPGSHYPRSIVLVFDFTYAIHLSRFEAGLGDGLGGGGLALAAAGPAHGEVLGRAPSLAVILAAGDVLVVRVRDHLELVVLDVPLQDAVVCNVRAGQV